MIAFGCAITTIDEWDRHAAPSIRRVAEPDSEVLGQASVGSIARNYNLILDHVAGREDLEALVLIHQDVEIVDPDFCQKLRQALEDPDVAIVGCAGAIGVRSIAWWEGSVTWASFAHQYTELGGGDLEALSWNADKTPSFARTGEVDAVDGILIAMSPWAVRELRFDESLGLLHGHDYDISLQARAAGKKVVAEDLRVIHHHSLELIRDPESWIEAHVKLADKWEGKLSGALPPDWKRRARRSEAEAAAARLQAMLFGQILEARISAVNREIGRIEASVSWRLTRPLRALKRVARRSRGRE